MEIDINAVQCFGFKYNRHIAFIYASKTGCFFTKAFIVMAPLNTMLRYVTLAKFMQDGTLINN